MTSQPAAYMRARRVLPLPVRSSHGYETRVSSHTRRRMARHQPGERADAGATAGIRVPSRERSRTTQPPPAVFAKSKRQRSSKSPEGYPNGIAVAPEGLRICEQKSDNAVLVDWKGKLLKTLKSQSKNTERDRLRRRLRLDGWEFRRSRRRDSRSI